MKIKAWEIAAAAAVLLFVLCLAAVNEQAALSEKLIRLHVVAHSDALEDQALKLKVRDAVLETAGQATAGAKDAKEAEARLTAGLAEIEAAGKKAAAAEGYDYNITASLGRERFTARDYDTFSLPAGEYTTLRVVIGEGQGRNWWCVCFPPLCTQTVTEWKKTGLDERQTAFITGGGGAVRAEFYTLTLLEKIKEAFD
ncbi:MAG: stage II sporulation protein R [Oscillospiraceae bacterium]|nr:stage II sporulation protein R [Oscillospiraceae bacterium]